MIAAASRRFTTAPNVPCVAIAAWLALSASVVADEVVVRRGGADPIRADAVEISPGGVTVIRSSGTRQIVAWDMVRAVESDDDTVRRALERHADRAGDLWRARARLQRGDARLAEPLFEEWFDVVRTDARDGELALIVAEGLLRSRLALGHAETAVPAALETVRLRRRGVTTDRFAGLPRVIDEANWLVPDLPPFATNAQDASRALEAISTWLEDEDAIVSGLARAYAAAFTRAAGRVATASPEEGGSPVLATIDALRSPVPDVRSRAIGRIEDGAFEDAPAWIDGWLRLFVARARLADLVESAGTADATASDAALRKSVIDRVVLDCLEVAARFGGTRPILAGRAAAAAASVLSTAGRDEEAARVRRTLGVSLPDLAPPLELVAAAQDAAATPPESAP